MHFPTLITTLLLALAPLCSAAVLEPSTAKDRWKACRGKRLEIPGRLPGEKCKWKDEDGKHRGICIAHMDRLGTPEVGECVVRS
ncbi:hypothetical protein BDV96DRAFT_313357 [Lophiotrema nucula]|uniref:Uncharacterized protein n=1 Tax=Lophiotrema nucula TaxID=690887 RepID=A0A6A5ZNU4_9PLEO|nr:hypothetical protein BDV96DRAFT_313357 [Lophiotrema nucula]